MNVALVHDYLNQRGGAERVFAHIAGAWPQAPVYTALYDERSLGDLIPGGPRPALLPREHSVCQPLVSRARAALSEARSSASILRGYDAIVSSTTAWAKGVLVPPGAVHVCYINTVSRFAFAYDEYVGIAPRASVRGRA